MRESTSAASPEWNEIICSISATILTERALPLDAIPPSNSHGSNYHAICPLELRMDCNATVFRLTDVYWSPEPTVSALNLGSPTGRKASPGYLFGNPITRPDLVKKGLTLLNGGRGVGVASVAAQRASQCDPGQELVEFIYVDDVKTHATFNQSL